MEIVEGVTVTVNGSTVTAKGPSGEVSKYFAPPVKVATKGKEVEVSGPTKMIINTIYAHLKNMMKGAKEGYKLNLKMIHAHFPITLVQKGAAVEIKNFLGEKKNRSCTFMGKTKLESKGQDVTISGPDLEHVTQSYANLKRAMKIKDKDGRVFQDGVYPTN